MTAVKVHDRLVLSGQGPRRLDDRNASITGRIPDDLSIEQAYDAARLVGVNMLSTLKAQLGSLDRVRRLIRAHGMVNASPGFTRHPRVLDGFSDLMVEAFGPAGMGARSAVGMSSLPNNICLEVEAEFLVSD